MLPSPSPYTRSTREPSVRSFNSRHRCKCCYPLRHLTGFGLRSEPDCGEAFTGRRRELLQRKLGRVAAGPLVPPQISRVLNRKGHKVRGKKGEIEKQPGRFDSTGVVILTAALKDWSCGGWRSASSQQFGLIPLIEWVFFCFHDYLHCRMPVKTPTL